MERMDFDLLEYLGISFTPLPRILREHTSKSFDNERESENHRKQAWERFRHAIFDTSCFTPQIGSKNWDILSLGLTVVCTAYLFDGFYEKKSEKKHILSNTHIQVLLIIKYSYNSSINIFCNYFWINIFKRLFFYILTCLITFFIYA